MRKYWPWLLFTFTTLGVSLVLAVTQYKNQIVFSFDQARDAFEAYAIWHNHDVKILGPATDIPGVFHGVLWYYFLAVIYFFGRDVSSAVLISLTIFYFSVPLLALLTQKLFKSFKITSLAVSLYVLSPLFQAFSRWLSNPSLALLVTPVLLLFLWKYLIKSSRHDAFFSGLFFGALIQTNFAYGIMVLLVPIYLWYFRIKPRFSHIVLFGVGILTSVSSFIVADLKFGGQAISAMMKFFLHERSDSNVSAAVLSLFDRIFEMLSLTVLPWQKLVSVIFLIFVTVKLRQKKFRLEAKPVAFLFIWISGFVIMQILSSAVSGSAHILATFIFPVTILFAYFLFNSRLLFVILLILISQFTTLTRWTRQSYSPLSVQRGMFLSSELKIIDYTYQTASGKAFIINSVTNPLYINTTWAYLYQFYGLPKYGYLPFWGGRNQTGYLGNLPQKPFGENKRFLIIEDLAGIDPFYLEKAIYYEDKVSDVIEDKIIGKLRVQNRIFHADKGPIPLPPLLLKATPDLLVE